MKKLIDLSNSSITIQQFDAVVSERLRYIYVYVFKSAHTTIKRKLWQIENAYGYHKKIPENYFGVHYPKRIKEPFEQPWPIYCADNRNLLLNNLVEDYLKFTVVRNPYSRLLSAYLDKLKRREHFEDDKKEELRLHFNLKRYPTSFADFVSQVCRQQDEDANPHWQSQTFIISFDLIHYDKIGHVENLAGFYAFLQRQFPEIKDNIAHSENILHFTSAATQLTDFYTPELQQQVYLRYKNDFINFGYSKKLETVIAINSGKISGSYRESLKYLLANGADQNACDSSCKPV